MFDLLEKIPEDYTYRQDAAQTKLAQWYREGHRDFHRLDLTAARDRLPLALQSEILGLMGLSVKFVEM